MRTPGVLSSLYHYLNFIFACPPSRGRNEKMRLAVFHLMMMMMMTPLAATIPIPIPIPIPQGRRDRVEVEIVESGTANTYTYDE